MTNKILKKQEVEKMGVNPVLAAVTGAIVGGLAVAGAAVAYNDKNNQAKVKKMVAGAKDKVQEVKSGIEDKVAVGQGKLKRVAEVIKE